MGISGDRGLDASCGQIDNPFMIPDTRRQHHFEGFVVLIPLLLDPCGQCGFVLTGNLRIAQIIPAQGLQLLQCVVQIASALRGAFTDHMDADGTAFKDQLQIAIIGLSPVLKIDIRHAFVGG